MNEFKGAVEKLRQNLTPELTLYFALMGMDIDQELMDGQGLLAYLYHGGTDTATMGRSLFFFPFYTVNLDNMTSTEELLRTVLHEHGHIASYDALFGEGIPYISPDILREISMKIGFWRRAFDGPYGYAAEAYQFGSVERD